MFFPQHIRDDLFQQSLDHTGIGGAGFLDLFTELFNDSLGGFDSDVRHNQCLFQLFQKVLINFGKRVDNPFHLLHHRILGFLDAFSDLFKKAHVYSSYPIQDTLQLSLQILRRQLRDFQLQQS